MTAAILISRYPTEIAAIKAALVQDFDTPAQRTINAGFAAMGVQRFTTAGDDLWEQVVCLENGLTYEKPPEHLRRRWARY